MVALRLHKMKFLIFIYGKIQKDPPYYIKGIQNKNSMFLVRLVQCRTKCSIFFFVYILPKFTCLV